MPRLTDIDDIRDSLNDCFGRIEFGDGAFKVYTPIVVTFYTSGHKNLETYNTIKEYLARNSKMYVFFNFFGFYMPPYNTPHTSFEIEYVERTPNTLIISLRPKNFRQTDLFPYNDFFEAFESRKWKLTIPEVDGLRYVAFNETK